jgi:pentatricopeptide repeat protein
VLKASPDNILASRLLGECLEGTGDLTGAAQRYRATLTLAPGDKQVQARLDAVEALLKARPMPAAEPAASQVAPDAPIPLVAAEESFELESPHQSFRSTPAAEPNAEAASVPVVGTPGFGVPEGGFPTEPATPPAPATAEQSEPPVAPPPPPQPEVPTFDFDAGAPAAPELPPPAPSAATEAPPAAPPESPAPAEPALASLTLAELYFNQGFTDKAIDVYRQMLEREPDNERAQARLTELQALERRLKAEEQRSPAVAAAPQDPRAVRRAAIERTIAQLESMLAAVRRD